MSKILRSVLVLSLFLISVSNVFAEIAAAHVYHNHMPNFWPYYDVTAYETTPVGGAVRYTYDGQVIKKKREGMSLVKGGMTTTQAIISSKWPYWVPATMLDSDGKTVPFVAGGNNNPEKYYNTPMPHDDLANDGIGPYGSGYYVQSDKRDVYNHRPPDLATILNGKQKQAQMHLTMSGALMNNIQSIRDEGVIPEYYPKGEDWFAPWRVADSTLKTTDGNKTFDMVHFTGHHTMGPLMGNDVFLKELIYHNTVLAQPQFFGNQFKSSKGFFPTELGFSERLIPVLDKIGVEWSVAGSTHFARSLDDYPQTWRDEVGLDLNTSPPNRADAQTTDPFTGAWEEREMKNSSGGYQLDGKVRPNMITTVKYPFSAIPGWVRYVDPNTGAESRIAAMPVDEAGSWMEGFVGSVIPETQMKYDTIANTKGRKMFFGIAHDGDNNRGASGGYSTWANAANVTYATAGVKGMGVDEYLKENPIPNDYVIHVQDGSWADTMDSAADPTWNHWRIPMGIWNGDPSAATAYAKGSGQWPDFRKVTGKNYGPKKTLRGGYDQYTVSFEYGYNYMERNYALLQAAVNYTKTAEQIWLDDHPNYWKPTTAVDVEIVGKKNTANQLNPWMYSYPIKGDAANDYKGGANPAELAWYFAMASIDSGFGYYDENIDDAAKPTISFNQSLYFSEPYVKTNIAKDKTGPSLWWPQRFPHNPGSANTNKQDGWKAQYFNNTMGVYTYAYDVSGIKNMTLKVRPHRDKKMTPIENACRVYDPAAAKASGVANVDVASVGAWVDYPMTGRDLTPDINGVKWQPTTTGLFGTVPAQKIGFIYFAYVRDYRDQLVDYYIEGVDNKGNVTKSEIQQVYIGAGRYTNSGTYKFIEDINGTIEGTDPFVTDKEPPLPEQSVILYVENTEAGNVVYQYKTAEGDWSTSRATSNLSVAPKIKNATFTYNSNTAEVSVRYSDDGGNTWKPSATGVKLTTGSWSVYSDGTFENKSPAGITYTATIYYKGTANNIHWAQVGTDGKVITSTWTVAPGVKMDVSDDATYTLKKVLDLGINTKAMVCFNKDGISTSWDSDHPVDAGTWNYDAGTKTFTPRATGPDTTAPTLTASKPTGTYSSDLQIILTASDNQDTAPSIYYTIDGITPTTTSGIKYSSAVGIVDKITTGIDTTLKAIAVDKAGNISTVYSFDYTIDKTLADTLAPIVSVNNPAGKYTNDITLVITATDDKDANPTINYTVNGVAQTGSKTVSINLTDIKATGVVDYTITVTAQDATGNKSTIATYEYTIDKIVVETDTIPPVVTANYSTGIYTNAISVALSITDDKDTNPVIYYTTDGTTPTVSLKVYGTSIPVTDTAVNGVDMTIRALGVDKTGNKKEYTFSYTIKTNTADTDNIAPTVSISPDPSIIYNKDITVTITATDDKTQSPTVYYTLNGSLPKPYRGAITLKDAKNSLKVIAYDKAGNVSNQMEYEYIIQR